MLQSSGFFPSFRPFKTIHQDEDIKNDYYSPLDSPLILTDMENNDLLLLGANNILRMHRMWFFLRNPGLCALGFYVTQQRDSPTNSLQIEYNVTIEFTQLKLTLCKIFNLHCTTRSLTLQFWGKWILRLHIKMNLILYIGRLIISIIGQKIFKCWKSSHFNLLIQLYQW